MHNEKRLGEGIFIEFFFNQKIFKKKIEEKSLVFQNLR